MLATSISHAPESRSHIEKPHAGPGEAAKGGQQLLMLARGMAKKRVENPEAAKQYTGGYPESAEAIRLYLEVLKVTAMLPVQLVTQIVYSWQHARLLALAKL